MDKSACFSSKSDDWKTPFLLYEFFMDRGFIDCFPYCSKVDQYEKQYIHEKLFINPPYSHLNTNKFYDWLVENLHNGCYVCLLIPSRTDTIFFHNIIKYCVSIYFFKGRLHFNDLNVAPFPSMLLTLNLNKKGRTVVFTGTVDDLIRLA